MVTAAVRAKVLPLYEIGLGWTIPAAAFAAAAVRQRVYRSRERT